MNIWGDVNRDKVVDVRDALAIARHLSDPSNNPLTREQQLLADIDGDQKVTIKDSMAISQWRAGLITPGVSERWDTILARIGKAMNGNDIPPPVIIPPARGVPMTLTIQPKRMIGVGRGNAIMRLGRQPNQEFNVHTTFELPETVKPTNVANAVIRYNTSLPTRIRAAWEQLLTEIGLNAAGFGEVHVYIQTTLLNAGQANSDATTHQVDITEFMRSSPQEQITLSLIGLNIQPEGSGGSWVDLIGAPELIITLTEDGVGPPTPKVLLSAFSYDITGPLAVSFTNLATGSFLTQEWDFGDGFSSVDKNPKHFYPRSGQYTVTLTIRAGIDSAVSQQIVPVPGKPEPKPVPIPSPIPIPLPTPAGKANFGWLLLLLLAAGRKK